MGQVVDPAALPALAAELRAQGMRVVFTNGYFDLLHAGHARYLRRARALGDALLVAVNADAAAQRAKDPRRPIQPQDDRVELVAALAAVDYAVLFTGDTAEDLVRLVQPAVYVKGGDYTLAGDNTPPEAAVAESYGGRAVILPLEEGRSTTAVIETILSRYCLQRS
jgi:rfaE bifunctional protein nucleotidyltransferase chain/domain